METSVIEPDTNHFRIRIGIINSKQMDFFLSFQLNVQNIENNYIYVVYDANEKDKQMWTGTAVKCKCK